MPSLGLVANIYNEARALPGWLECHLPLFDDVRLWHAGPQGEFSDDGTIEIAERWRVPMKFGSIDAGFGAVRTQAIRWSPCDYVMLLDADERFFPVHRVLTCSGEATPSHVVDAVLTRSYNLRGPEHPPDWDDIRQLGARLQVDIGQPYDQGARLREILATNPHLDVVLTVRRHWHDFSFHRPTQNWCMEPDWQARILRNDSSIYFDDSTRMHERLLGARNLFRADFERGPFFDHFHFFFKRMEVEQRSHDIAIYDAVNEGRQPPTWTQLRN